MSNAIVIDLASARRNRAQTRFEPLRSSPDAEPGVHEICGALLTATVENLSKKHRRALGKALWRTATNGEPYRRLAAYRAHQLLEASEKL